MGQQVSPWAQGGGGGFNRGGMGPGGLLPTPAGGQGQFALAGNLLASLANPGTASQLASSLLQLQSGQMNPGPQAPMGYNSSPAFGGGGGGHMSRQYDDRRDMGGRVS